jgi:hypothetical protein
MSLAKISQISPKYSCECCCIFTNNKKDYNNHLLTAKHKKNISFNNFSPIVSVFPQIEEPQISQFLFQPTNTQTNNDNKTTHTCEKCNKIYKSRVGLWYHIKKCETNDVEKMPILDTNLKMDLLKKDNLIEYLIKENSEFKGLIMELIKKDNSTNITNNTTNNTNCHNSFNLNLFLNEKCKDAINISDFVDNVKMQLSDLENFGHLGYVEGISRILIKNLNDLDTLKRPIHCSDLKREVLYIKDNNEWTKETEEKLVIKNAIKQVANKNIKQIQVWKNENPDCIHSESRKNDQYMNIVMNSMSGGTSEEQFNNISQIIKNVSKEVIINK